MVWTTLYVVLTFSATFVGTWLVLKLAVRNGLLDVPNARSSHLSPTPRGGGLAVVATVLVIGLVLRMLDLIQTTWFLAIVGGGATIAGVGLLDDRYGLSAGPRLSVHLAVAWFTVFLLGGFPVHFVGVQISDSGALGMLISALIVTWLVNLFNFMDGIDGIASAEGAFIFSAAALLTSTNGPTGLVMLFVGIAFANLGFLCWNWAPARIFMGDSGSGFMGYMVALAALMAAESSSIPIWTWMIITSLFVGDATTTLIRRLVRGDKWYVAHRTHAYQWLARRWASHARVTAAFTAVNVVVLLPIAYLSVRLPDIAAQLAFSTVALSGLVALLCGAGRREVP
jgi:Fuc2NAc and GlcNAc transferase